MKYCSFSVKSDGSIINEEPLAGYITCQKKATGNYLLDFSKINFQGIPNVSVTSNDEKGRVSLSGFASKTSVNVATFNLNTNQNPHDLSSQSEVPCDGNFTVILFGK